MQGLQEDPLAICCTFLNVPLRTYRVPPYLRTFHLKDSNLGGVEGCERAGAGLSKWKLATATGRLEGSMIYLITFIMRIDLLLRA